MKSTQKVGLPVLLLVGCLAVAPTAKASIYNVNGVVGDIFGTSTATPYTGLSVTGTLDITAIIGGVTSGAANITVQGDPNVFTGVLSCSVYPCASIFNAGFNEFGLINIGNPATFAVGGPLPAGSWIALGSPLGSNNETQYDLNAVTVTTGAVPAPEPEMYGILAIGLGGLMIVNLRRRRRA